MVEQVSLWHLPLASASSCQVRPHCAVVALYCYCSYQPDGISSCGYQQLLLLLQQYSVAEGIAISSSVYQQHVDRCLLPLCSDFYQFAPLKMDYNATVPEVSASSLGAKPVRLSTLMCPYTSFTYGCQLDSAVIRGSAIATTTGHTENRGGSIKQTWMWKMDFGGKTTSCCMKLLGLHV